MKRLSCQEASEWLFKCIDAAHAEAIAVERSAQTRVERALSEIAAQRAGASYGDVYTVERILEAGE